MVKSAISRVERELHDLRREQVELVPHHFSMRSMIGSLFGSLFFGLPFVLSTLLLEVTRRFTAGQLWFLFAAMIVVLSGEIYFIGYERVLDKQHRRFGQFWFKRIIAYLIIGFAVATFLTFVYGLPRLADNPDHVRNIIVALALPCCVGASIANLIKRY